MQSGTMERDNRFALKHFILYFTALRASTAAADSAWLLLCTSSPVFQPSWGSLSLSPYRNSFR